MNNNITSPTSMSVQSSQLSAQSSTASDHSMAMKKKKKKSKKKKKRVLIQKKRKPTNKSYSTHHERRESRPTHATIKSLASLNQPIIVNKLSKMSQDLKYQRELKKALLEIRQKDEDYRYAIEIGESLAKEKQMLSEQMEVLESHLSQQETDNLMLREKLQTSVATYNQDLQHYHADLEYHKALCEELKHSLQQKDAELVQQKAINSKKEISKTSMMKNDEIMQTNDDEKQRTDLEKELFLKYENEKKKVLEMESDKASLIEKLNTLTKTRQKYNLLKRKYENLKQITRDELQQHMAMQKSIEAEAIYLAATKANLEEQNEDLLNLLDQRDYELTMLNQQLALQQQRSQRAMTLHGNEKDDLTLGDDIINNQNEESEYFEYDHDDENESEDVEDEIDAIDEILDDVIFDDEESYDEEEEEEDEVNESKKVEKEEKEKEEKNEKAFDKIKEYLHLSASAVKIKYPLIRNIQSDELIKRVKELPFYKYHDQMVRIMEAEIKKKRDAEKKEKSDNQLIDGPPPTFGKRKSFLSIFNIFGGDQKRRSSLGSDVDENENVSDEEKDNSSEPGGISNRAQRKFSFKK